MVLTLLILFSFCSCFSPGKNVDRLILGLKHKDPVVRLNATTALGKTKDARAFEPLIAALKDEKYSVRRNAADALVSIGPPAVEPLIAALKDKDSSVRSGAAGALGKIKDARAVEPLIAALKDENSNVRSDAADALVSIGIPAVKSLIAALKDENSYVRSGAAGALGKIKDNR